MAAPSSQFPTREQAHAAVTELAASLFQWKLGRLDPPPTKAYVGQAGMADAWDGWDAANQRRLACAESCLVLGRVSRGAWSRVGRLELEQIHEPRAVSDADYEYARGDWLLWAASLSEAEYARFAEIAQIGLV